MKKILAVFLLLAPLCSAQVEHGGLTIPGDGAVQVVRKAPFNPITEYNVKALFVYSSYVQGGVGQIDYWMDVSGNGNNLKQATETHKPSLDGTFLDFTAAANKNVQAATDSTLLLESGNFTGYTVMVAGKTGANVTTFQYFFNVTSAVPIKQGFLGGVGSSNLFFYGSQSNLVASISANTEFTVGWSAAAPNSVQLFDGTTYKSATGNTDFYGQNRRLSIGCYLANNPSETPQEGGGKVKWAVICKKLLSLDEIKQLKDYINANY